MQLLKTLLPHRKPRSLVWQGDVLVDWVAGGNQYYLDGSVVDGNTNFGYRFDKAAALPDGSYAVIFEELGTKGLIIHNELETPQYRTIDAGNRTFSFKQYDLREVNRSYYFADTYSYPIALFRLPNGRPALLHCPEDYNRLEIDLLENGSRLTASADRDPADVFHTRLQVSPSGRYALSAGWVWHPVEGLWVFDLQRALEDPTHLDAKNGMEVDVASATFLADDRVALAIMSDVCHSEADLLGKSQIDIYDPEQEAVVHRVGVDLERITLLPTHDERYVWDVYQYPKIIDLQSGTVVAAAPEVDIPVSLYPALAQEGPYALHPDGQRLAVGQEDGITILHFDPLA
jgi:hypothetical protein